MIDRGFIKWQPFNSVASSSTILKYTKENKTKSKPTLFPEEEELIIKKILEAYYAKEIVNIIFYEEGQIKSIKTNILKLNAPPNTLKLNAHKTISFNQIIKIKDIND